MLESLGELDKAKSREAEEAKRRKSNDEQAKLVKDENSSLQSTITELREKEKQLKACDDVVVAVNDDAVLIVIVAFVCVKN